MGRVHLFEFEDQKWFPSFLRNYGTEFLQFISTKTKAFDPVIPLLLKALRSTHSERIIDLCSGGGGALTGLNSQLRKELPELKIILTDLYPNQPAIIRIRNLDNNITYLNQSIDARRVPEDLNGFRTLFLSFHHFKPGDAKRIIQDAVNSGNGIAVFEGQERSFASILAMIFSPVTLWLATPFIRPLHVGRIIFTYFIPLVPLFVLWDGIVSCFRTYSVKEMNEIIQNLDNGHLYDWQTGKLKSGPGHILYLIGNKSEL
jgi:hypothetical protein